MAPKGYLHLLYGYSWSENEVKKLFPVNEVTRITFTDDLHVLMIDVIQMNAPPDSNFSFFLTGFAASGYGKALHIFGGIAFPEYDREKENLHNFLPPETPRNKVPDPISQLLCLNLSEKTVSAVSGPVESASHNGSLQILNSLEPILMMTCDPHLYIYRPV